MLPDTTTDNSSTTDRCTKIQNPRHQNQEGATKEKLHCNKELKLRHTHALLDDILRQFLPGLCWSPEKKTREKLIILPEAVRN
jgi:hypothetical protein